MKLYLVQQNRFTEGDNGELNYVGLVLIGVYTNYDTAKAVVDNFTPVEFNAQYGSVLQDLVFSEIESDVQLSKPSTDDGLFDFEDDEEEITF